jgi:nucleotide-binding universal stress UspA family protein
MPVHNAIVVGLGDAHQPTTALNWAAREAVLRGAELRVIRAYSWSTSNEPWEVPAEHEIADDLGSAVDARVNRAIASLQREYPGLQATGAAVEGPAARLLVEQSEGALMTVLGSRNLSALGAAVMGSVSTEVAARAQGPVVVLAGPPGDPAENPAIVVGVDGTPEAETALEFAFEQASLHGRMLRAIFAWRPDTLSTMKWRAEPPAPERAQRWLAEALAGWQEKFPDVHSVHAVVRGHPVETLVLESNGAELLVVGGRSRHARVGALLGSASQGVLHHARCPVAVVHERGTD